MVRLESLDLILVRVLSETGFVAEKGKVFFVRKQVKRGGERVVGRLVRSGLVLVEVLLVRGEVAWRCG